MSEVIRNLSVNIDSIRRFCLSFPQATEKLQWGDALCFKIQGKLFAVLNLESVPPGITLKCSPEKFSELTELEGIVPAPYVGRYKWVLVESLDALPAAEMKELIKESYELVVAKMGKKRMARPLSKH